MTEEQWEQLRAILEIEGASPEDIEVLMADFRRKPDMAEDFVRDWKLVTETKQ